MKARATNETTRREFLKSSAGVALTASLAGAGCGHSAEAGAKKQPNVLIVFDDQLRADACGVYGGRNITTPHIDRMAAQGMTFTNAISSCPLCTPFRGMLMTGRHPTHSGMLVNFTEVNPNQRCLAHVFNDAGYRTGFIGKWHLSAAQWRNMDRFEGSWEQVRPVMEANPNFNFVPPGPSRLGFEHWEAFNFHVDFNGASYFRDEPKKLVMEDYETDGLTRMAIDFMKDCQAKDEPFFAVVAPHPPHPPFNPKACPAGYLDQITTDLHWAPNVPENHPRRKNKGMQVRCYYAMCKNMDDNVGRLLDFLDASGLSEDTIFVFTSDHGELHGSHDRINKKMPYAESVNIPMIMRWPGHIEAGVKTDALHTPIDHMATLCGILDVPAPDTADGRDLSGHVLGREKDSREEVLMYNHSSHWDFFQTGTTWPEWRGVKTKQYTYVKWLDGKEELYDDCEDPYQMNDLAQGGRHLPVQKRLRGSLKDLLAEAHDDFLPGTAYGEWVDEERNVIRSALGPF